MIYILWVTATLDYFNELASMALSETLVMSCQIVTSVD